MDPSRKVPLGTCNGFCSEWQKMQSVAPQGSGGNGFTPVKPPYGVTPIKYFPSGSSSVGRSMWDGWRYGANYTGPNERLVYGEPDWKYYRHNYCGPCGCAPPGYMGDPNGQNPNIRYVQLDYNNLLGSGFAQQGIGSSETSPFRMGTDPAPPPVPTSCGRQHCTECSGVYKARKQPVKFQVCIGDPNDPDTMPTCPQQDLKVYVPNQMIVKPQSNSGSGDCGGEEKKLPDFEVQIPGLTDGETYSENNNNANQSGAYVDPCGSCKACKTSKNVRPPQPLCGKDNEECVIKGQRYTNGPVLCNVKKPMRFVNLRKTEKVVKGGGRLRAKEKGQTLDRYIICFGR